MNCPHCYIPLLMTERKGVEIDYCSKCRGIWLDKGELDKIIKLSVNEPSLNMGNYYTPSQKPQKVCYNHDYQFNKNQHGYYHGKSKRHKSLLGEMFDFFD